MLTPDYPTFARLAAHGTLIPVAREFLFDSDTGVSAYHKLRRPPFGFLLESLVGGEKWARYTFVGTAPRSAWRLEAGGRVSTWSPEAGWSEARPVADPLGELDATLRAARPVAVPGLPRFFGGAVGYLGYDVIRYIEQLPHAPPDPLGLPEALLIFTDTVLAIDNIFGRAHAVTTADLTFARDASEVRRCYDRAVARLDAVVDALASRPAPAPLELPAAVADVPFASSYSREAFECAVQRIREYIVAGDAFQVVLSQRLTVPLRRDALDVYRALRALNPSPYLFFLELDGITLVGSSPEVLVRVEEGTVTVRPIAGTRARGRSDEEDTRLCAELLADDKERAEHLMLVDLGRNDVGRVARFGSVRVPAIMNIEKYSHVLHMVSQVDGELRDGLSAIDVFRACFPAGTVSGAPKIRAMEIIDELEPVRRGVYTGAIGYWDASGDCDWNIAIRTISVVNGVAYFHAGGGIVADSTPEGEYEETLVKATGMMRALGV
jgi:anthranilate synthase component I